MIELGRLLVEVCRNLILFLGLFILGVAALSSIQLSQSELDASDGFKRQFFANIGVFRPDLKVEIPTPLPQAGMVAAGQMVKVEENARVEVKESLPSQAFLKIQDLKANLKAIETKPVSEKLDSLISLRSDVVDAFRENVIPEQSYDFLMREVQKRVYWQQKFMSVQQLSLGDTVTDSDYEELVVPAEAIKMGMDMPPKNKRKKSKLAKGLM